MKYWYLYILILLSLSIIYNCKGKSDSELTDKISQSQSIEKTQEKSKDDDSFKSSLKKAMDSLEDAKLSVKKNEVQDAYDSADDAIETLKQLRDNKISIPDYDKLMDEALSIYNKAKTSVEIKREKDRLSKEKEVNEEKQPQESQKEIEDQIEDQVDENEVTPSKKSDKKVVKPQANSTQSSRSAIKLCALVEGLGYSVSYSGKCEYPPDEKMKDMDQKVYKLGEDNVNVIYNNDTIYFIGIGANNPDIEKMKRVATVAAWVEQFEPGIQQKVGDKMKNLEENRVKNNKKVLDDRFSFGKMQITIMINSSRNMVFSYKYPF